MPSTASRPPEPLEVRVQGRRFDLVFLSLFSVLYLGVALATLSDYGVGWDVSEMYVGDRTLQFYTTLDADYLDYAKPMPIPEYAREDHPDFDAVLRSEHVQIPVCCGHHVWPGGVLTSSITNKLFFSWLGWLGAIESRHFAAVLWLWALSLAVYAFLRHYAGRWPAVIATLCLVTSPRVLAHSHFNVKDMPSCAMFSFVALTFFVAVERRSWRWMLVSAAAWGIGLSVKANLLFLPVILIPWWLIIMVRRFRRDRELPTQAMRRALVSYPVVALVFTALCWPYLLAEFPTHISAHVAYLFERGYGEVHGWQKGPLLSFLATTPAIVLALMLVGVLGLGSRRAETRMRELGGLLLLWMGVTLLRVSIPTAVDFDGIRHWLEIVVPTCMLAGLGGARLLNMLEGRLLHGRPGAAVVAARSFLILLALAPVSLWSVRNHPHQIAYYNWLFGGLPGARELKLTSPTDYWGVTSRSAMRWLNQNAEPGAIVMPLLAAHNFDYTAKVWLRKDLELIAINSTPADEVKARLDSYEGPIYVSYITLTSKYSDQIRWIDANYKPVKTFDVEGEPLYKIFRVELPGTSAKDAPLDETPGP